MNFDPIVDRLTDGNDYDAFSVLHGALADPEQRGAALAALQRNVDGPDGNFGASHLLARERLDTGDLDGYTALTRHPLARVRAGVLDAFWSTSSINVELQIAALPLVHKAMADASPDVRAVACRVLKNTAGQKMDVAAYLPRLMERLADPSADVRFEATWAAALLARRELDLSPHIPLLQLRLHDANEHTRPAAAKALWNAANRKVDISECIPDLERALSSDYPDLRKYAKGALAAARRHTPSSSPPPQM